MSKHIHFTKMHGAGNDYIYVYTPQNSIPDPAEASIEWSRQHFGIGSDGLILIGDSPVPEADFSMRIFNNDGSEALMCGNGVRCVAKFVYDHKLTSKTDIAIDTLSGIKLITLHPNANGEVESATVDMGTPILSSKHLLATADGSMTDGTLRMRVWERGSGITLACGTGACATAVAACLTGRSGRKSRVEMDGGTLEIEWNEQNGHIMMTGPAVTVFEGDILLPTAN